MPPEVRGHCVFLLEWRVSVTRWPLAASVNFVATRLVRDCLELPVCGRTVEEADGGYSGGSGLHAR